MTVHLVKKRDVWCVDDPNHVIGGVFVDLASALRFVRQHASAVRIVVRVPPEANEIDR